jgi:hypothetical protein
VRARTFAVLILGSCSLAFAVDPTQFLDAHCLECHDAETRKGKLDLSELGRPEAQLETWVHVFDRVAADEMPPAKEERPDAAERAAFLKDLRERLHRASSAKQARTGRVGQRRLNRHEYENTINELLGISLPLHRSLPEETPTLGFDTVASGLRLSALHMEKYFEAADFALGHALNFQASPESRRQRFSYKDEKEAREILDTPDGKVKDAAGNTHRVILKELPDSVVFFTEGFWPTELRQFKAPATGQYQIRISANAYQSRGRYAMMRVYRHKYRGKTLLGYFDMPPGTPRVVEFRATLEEGELLQVVPYGIGFDDNGKTVWNISAPTFTGSGLAIQWVEVEGPLGAPGASPSLKKLFGDLPVREIPDGKRPWRDGRRVVYELVPDDPGATVRQAILAFAPRAFRRPLEVGEADRFLTLAADSIADGRRADEAFRVAARAILTAPQFLLFSGAPGQLDGHALANRLSYFLTSSMPDSPLLAAAQNLHDPAQIRAQTDRLLDGPRAANFVSNFAGQWLGLRQIDATTPDMRIYPEYDEMLKLAAVGEAEAFFAHLLVEDLPLRNIIDSDFLLLNSRIAEHYGIPGVDGEHFRIVSRPSGSPRGGVLTQAAVLKVTANGTVTSPVMRGAWTMKHLLGVVPRPPPPNIGSIEPDTRGATTVREQLDKHRNLKSCAVCHKHMDPPGFALESFDVIGGWRERYRSLDKGDKAPGRFRGREIWEYKLGPPVDASGVLPDGRRFTDIREFKAHLLADEDRVLRCLTEKLITYSTGAGISFADRREVERIVEAVKSKGGGLRSLVHEIVQSSIFTHN